MMSDSLGQEAVQLLQFKKKGSLELTNTEGRKSAQQLKKKKKYFFWYRSTAPENHLP